MTAEPIELDILYESDRVIVINKPAGLVVHPGAGNWTGTLAQGLLHHVARLESAFAGSSRPGIVHRLDKDTSGVLIAAKEPEMLAALADQFKRRRASKHYLALVKGRLPRSQDTIDTGIQRDERNRKKFRAAASGEGKQAVTDYRVLRHYAHHSFLSLRPRTGRTHQLRVHMASLGCPIVGDPLYARRDADFPDAPMMLHAYQLRVYLPDEERWAEFTAALPERFKSTLRSAWGLP
jgi:23S rRNA pseudouridine1911/1915/1917 synthase